MRGTGSPVCCAAPNLATPAHAGFAVHARAVGCGTGAALASRLARELRTSAHSVWSKCALLRTLLKGQCTLLHTFWEAKMASVQICTPRFCEVHTSAHLFLGSILNGGYKYNRDLRRSQRFRRAAPAYSGAARSFRAGDHVVNRLVNQNRCRRRSKSLKIIHIRFPLSSKYERNSDRVSPIVGPSALSIMWHSAPYFLNIYLVSNSIILHHLKIYMKIRFFVLPYVALCIIMGTETVEHTFRAYLWMGIAAKRGHERTGDPMEK